MEKKLKEYGVVVVVVVSKSEVGKALPVVYIFTLRPSIQKKKRKKAPTLIRTLKTDDSHPSCPGIFISCHCLFFPAALCVLFGLCSAFLTYIGGQKCMSFSTMQPSKKITFASEIKHTKH